MFMGIFIVEYKEILYHIGLFIPNPPPASLYYVNLVLYNFVSWQLYMESDGLLCGFPFPC